MPLTINDYFDKMQKRDFLREMQYRVTVLNYGDIAVTLDDLVYLKTGDIPSRTITQVPVPFMGLNFSVPGTVQYPGTMNLTFYCDQPQIIRSTFEAMSYAAFDDRYSGGSYTVQRTDTLIFQTFDNAGPENITTQYLLEGIYPTEVGAITMDTTGNGQTTTLSVTIAYQYWTKLTAPVQTRSASNILVGTQSP